MPAAVERHLALVCRHQRVDAAQRHARTALAAVAKRLSATRAPLRVSALINLWGLALVTPLGLWQALSFDFGSVSAGHWWLLLFYSLAASMVTVWLWMKGLQQVPAPRAGVFSVMLPVSAAAICPPAGASSAAVASAIAMRKPSPSAPIRFSTGTRTPSCGR